MDTLPKGRAKFHPSNSRSEYVELARVSGRTQINVETCLT